MNFDEHIGNRIKFACFFDRLPMPFTLSRIMDRLAQYMRMAYDDVKKTLQETSSINTWEFVYENKNIDGVLFKSYLLGNSPHNKQ